jgi:hypothetical protein
MFHLSVKGVDSGAPTGFDLRLHFCCEPGLTVQQSIQAYPNVVWHECGTCKHEVRQGGGAFGWQSFSNCTLELAHRTLQGSITHWLCPGEEMAIRNNLVVTSTSRLGVSDPVCTIPHDNRKYVRVSGEGEKRFILAKLPEADDHHMFHTWVDVEDEVHLRERFVFPPWRLLTHDASLSDLVEEEGVDRGFFTYSYPHKQGHNVYMIHPQPFGETKCIPTFARPQVLLSERGESTVKAFAMRYNAHYDEHVRLYLGPQLSLEDRIIARDQGYIVSLLDDGCYRVVFPKPNTTSPVGHSVGRVKHKPRLDLISPLDFTKIGDGYKRLPWPKQRLW